MVSSSEKLSGALPTANEMMEKLALTEAKKAEDASRKHARRKPNKKGTV